MSLDRRPLRYFRSTREAFPAERAGCISGPYRNVGDFGHRVVAFVCIVIGVPALLHVIYRWGQ